MCSPLKDKCRACLRGYNPQVINRVPKTFAAYRLEAAMTRDRRCCIMCDEPPSDNITSDMAQNVYAEKERLHKSGEDKHNPCEDCGALNRCAAQIAKGYLT